MLSGKGTGAGRGFSEGAHYNNLLLCKNTINTIIICCWISFVHQYIYGGTGDVGPEGVKGVGPEGGFVGELVGDGRIQKVFCW